MTVEASILDVLERNPQGLDASALAQAVASGGTRADIATVSRLLCALQAAGRVELSANRRWLLKTRTPRSRPVRGTPPGAAQAGGGAAPAGDAPIFAVPVRAAPAPPLQRKPPPLGGDAPVTPDWALFRALLPYYRACLKAEERPDLVAGLDRAGRQFVLLHPQGRWWPAEDAGVTLTVPVSGLPPAFVDALGRRGRDHVYIGYPLTVVRPKGRGETPFLRPVAVLAADWRIAEGTLHLSIDPEPPQVSTKWTEWLRSQRRDTQQLLSWLGVTPDEEGADAASPFLDMESFAGRLGSFLPGEVRGPLRPGAPDIRLDPGASGGIHNLLGLFLPEETRYSRGAVQELQEIEGWDDGRLGRTALRAFFNPALAGPPEKPPVVLEPLALGDDQLHAVRDGLSGPLTVVTGPPGTGKSQVAAALMASAALSGLSVLFASRNHKAIDAVEEKLADLTGDRRLLTRVSFPFGESVRFDFAKAVEALLAKPGNADRSGLDAVIGRLHDLDERRWRMFRDADERQALGERLGTLTVDVERLEERLGGRSPRGFGWHALLERWRQGRERARLALLRRERESAEAAVARLPEGGPAGEALVDLTVRIRDGAVQAIPRLLDAMETLSEGEHAAVTTVRGDLALNRQAGERGRALIDRLWQDARDLLLRHFPLWAVTNLSVAGRLPLQPALFDLVVIDEASQCDIASALPLLARARHAVIVGDPAQLEHASRLGIAWEVETLQRFGLHRAGIGRYIHTTNSLFALAASSPAARRHMLRDHYRCHPDIAGYVSEAFYGGRLHVLTREATLRPPAGTPPGLHWTDVTGSVEKASSGCRCPAEVEAVVAHARTLLVEQGYAGTIGVVTPFREQANRLMDALADAIPAELLTKAELRAFTAHKFQGDARDVMLFSLCGGPDMPPGSLGYIRDTGNLVNVAVSRARAVCHVFGNRAFAASCGIPHVQALLRAVERPARPPSGTGVFESPWEERLYAALRARGLDPIPQYPLAGRRLDLALVRGGVRIDVEVDGDRYHRDPDGLRKPSDLWRDHQIRGLGWRVLRFWVYELREGMEACVDRIVAELDAV